MTGILTVTEVEAYERDGYLFPIKIFEEEEMAAYYARIESFTEAHPDEGAQPFRNKCHLLFPWLHDLIQHPKILDRVESVLGPNILCWSSGFFTKQAHDPAFVTWHQDSTYWGLQPMDIATAWLAFNPSTTESGCMAAIPGTHKAGQLAHADTFAEGNLLSRGQHVADDIDDSTAVNIVLRPGEMSLHHVRIVHGSGPNRSDLPRFGFTVRYIGTHVRQLGGRTTATLIRGQDDYGHFDPEPRPKADFDDEARAFHAESLARTKPILMAGAEQVEGARGVGELAQEAR